MGEGVIVWGAFDQTTNRVIIQRLPDQTHASLLALIAAFIAPQSTILSDGWLRGRTNDLVTDLHMHMHYWVNHSNGVFAEQVTDPLLGIESFVEFLNNE